MCIIDSLHLLDEQLWNGTALLLYVKSLTDRLSRLLWKQQGEIIYRRRKVYNGIWRWPKVKKPCSSRLKVYKIPFSCGQVYIATTKRSLATREKNIGAVVVHSGLCSWSCLNIFLQILMTRCKLSRRRTLPLLWQHGWIERSWIYSNIIIISTLTWKLRITWGLLDITLWISV